MDKINMIGDNHFEEDERFFVLETAFKGLISAFPYVGGLASIITDIQAKRKQERLIKFVNSLRSDIIKLTNQINTVYTNNDEFLDVFETTIKYTINERSEEKRKYFKNILKNSMIDNYADYDKTEKYLRIIDGMDDLELLLLKIFNDPKNYNFENGNLIDPNEKIGLLEVCDESVVLGRLLPNYTAEDITIAWNDLDSRWLIDVSMTPLSKEPISNPLDVLNNRLLKKGKELVNYILE